jgi:hypothetical protein
VTAALRPETHGLLSASQLVVVQAHLGHTLRDVYLQMTALGVGSMICALWLPNKEQTLGQVHPDSDEFDDDGLAVAASEL